jgi:DNA replication protein DnaC
MAAIEHAVKTETEHAVWRLSRKKKLGYFEIMKRLATLDISAAIDVVKILETANHNKHFLLWQQEQERNRQQQTINRQQELQEFWTANRMLQFMRWTSTMLYQKKLIENQHTLPLIKTVCYFLSRDPRFETELGYTFRRGLLIRGISGLGKTHVPKCAADNELNPVRMLSMVEITDQIKQEGNYQLKMEGKKLIYLDDVGTEETPVNYFGTRITWFKDFLELYYSKDRPFANLMISTNISFDQIEQKYGFRVRSRMKDMFNVLDVRGTDMRGL